MYMNKRKMSDLKIKRLYFDIETSPNIGYFWGAGPKVYIPHENIIKERSVICVSYMWEGDKKPQTITWSRNGSDKQLLKKFIKILNQADEIIAHNGAKFDVRWLRARCLYHNIPMRPFYTMTDTYKLARHYMYLNSYKLDYVARYLGIGHKTETGGFSLWVDVLKGDKGALKKMVEYCEHDVVLLREVYQRLKNYVAPTTHHHKLSSGLGFSCPDCGSTDITLDKTRTTASGIIKRQMRCKNTGCNRYFTISDTAYNQFVEYKKQ